MISTLYDDKANKACMYDSTTGAACGPVVGFARDGTHPIDLLREFREWFEANVPGLPPRTWPMFSGALTTGWARFIHERGGVVDAS